MNMKKVAAIVLAATMVMGSSLTAFAADNEGAADGAGKNEGHVDKEVVNVILPTTQAGQASPFDFITDPERLIQDTAGAKYDGFTFPEKDNDTGVYFKVGADTYANKSEALQIINKSSVNVTVTVKVKATENSDAEKKIPLAQSASTTKEAPLYLNLTVGKSGTVVKADEQSVSKTIAGAKDNFEVVYDAEDNGGTYKYAPKASATNWKALEIALDGAINKDYVAKAESAAPTVNVTWSYAKAEDSASVDTNDQVDYITGPSISIDTSAGTITINNLDGTLFDSMTLDDGTGTYGLSNANGNWDEWGDGLSDAKVYKLGPGWFPDYLKGKTVVVTVNLTEGGPIKSASVAWPE